jgi:hypothetical protein
LLAWQANGFASDGTIDMDTFCQPGEAPGQITDLTIEPDALMPLAAE